MDHVSDATRDGVRNRRKRMREQARSQHPAQPSFSDRYQTPEWLERSFVLPLTKPEASDVPSQSVPHHDDDPTREARVTERGDTLPVDARPADSPPATAFVRPPSDHVDFALVVRRSDLCRTATRVHWAATGLAGLALVGYLLVVSVVLLDVVVVLALVALAAFVVRLRLSRAPVPRLPR